MKTTRHAKDRMRERSGLNKRSCDRVAEKALKEGLKHNQLNGSLRKWVDGLYLSHGRGNNIRLYGDKAFIFQNEVLITILQIPSNLAKEVVKLKKKLNAENLA